GDGHAHAGHGGNIIDDGQHRALLAECPFTQLPALLQPWLLLGFGGGTRARVLGIAPGIEGEQCGHHADEPRKDRDQGMAHGSLLSRVNRVSVPGTQKALMPVTSRPTTSWCTVSVHS